ncbi:MAG: hypothetical protein QXK06_01685, partial [Candidatus Diapherotrites archaeon]
EDELAVILPEESEDIERRLNAAKLALKEGSSDSAAFDAASALALAKAERAIQGKGYPELIGLLSEKISKLEAQFLSEEQTMVWAKLYFDHAKYFYDSAKYFEKQKATPEAAENAKAGLRLAFFAEELLLVTRQAKAELASASVETIKDWSKPKITPKIQVAENNTVTFFILVLVLLVVIAGIALVGAIKLSQNKKQEGFISKRIERLEKAKESAEKARFREKLSEEEFQKIKSEHEDKLAALEEEKRIRSKHLIETDRLHGEIQMIQFMLKELKAQYEKGEIIDSDYREALDSLTNRLASVKLKASEEEAEVSNEEKKIARLKAESAKEKPSSEKEKAKPKTAKTSKAKWAFKKRGV